jgi:hypothetical protein
MGRSAAILPRNGGLQLTIAQLRALRGAAAREATKRSLERRGLLQGTKPTEAGYHLLARWDGNGSVKR